MYEYLLITVTEPTIIININKLYNRFMTSSELYHATRSSWKIGIKRGQAEYVVGAYRGLVREVFHIENWNAVGKRWKFTGQVAEPAIRDKYMNQSLDNCVKKGS